MTLPDAWVDLLAGAPGDWWQRMAALPAEGGPTGAEWIQGLSRALERVTADWALEPDDWAGTAPVVRVGHTAIVLPVRRAGEPAALKLCWPHHEASAEHLALRRWDGDGAVRLLAADPGRAALLLERLEPDTDLDSARVDTGSATELIGGLLTPLHVPPPPNVPRLGDHLRRQLARMQRRPDMPRRMVQRVSGLASDLLAEPDAEATLVHGDLHFANVLAAQRLPWLAIDPKPMAGHPGWEIQAVLRNRRDELGTGSGLRWVVRWRLETLCDAMGLDPEVGRLWAIVHTGVQVLWALEDADADAASLHISSLKALED